MLRVVCLVPVLMGGRTLALARGNGGMYVAGAPVKIRREEVEALIAQGVASASDDDALRAGYARLFEAQPAPRVARMGRGA